MKTLLIRTTTALLTVACLISGPALAQEKSEAETLEELKLLTLACAVVYQVQLDANAVSDRTLYATRQKNMQDVHMTLSEKTQVQVNNEINGVKGGFDDIRKNEPEKFKNYFDLCEQLSSD